MSEKEDRIENAFDAMNRELALPESLKAENIEKLVRDREQIPEKQQKKHARHFAAVAVVAVVLLAGVLSLLLQKPFQKVPSVRQPDAVSVPEQEAFVFCDSLKTYTSYAQLQNAAAKTAAETRLFNSFGASSTAIASNADVSADGYASETFDSYSSASEAINVDDFGKTNVQVENADEADILKNDGRYLYHVVRNVFGAESCIRIFDCAEPKELREASHFTLSGEEGETVVPSELYINGNTLIVIADVYPELDAENSDTESVVCYSSACSVSYYGIGGKTAVYFYDISDRTNPVKSERFIQDGSYLGSRMINGAIVLWTSYHADLSTVQTAKETCIPSTSAGSIAIDRIATLGDYAGDYVLLSELVFADGEITADSAAVNGNGFEAYCTTDTLYLASYYWIDAKSWDADYYSLPDEAKDMSLEVTRILSFGISDGIHSLSAGKVIGVPLNQFSLDEYNGYLRIATNGLIYEDQMNFVSVLDRDNLQVVGFLPDIAPGESIKSARFIGTTCYLVTFYQTDPLFVIDLADAENPVIRGELEMPGFSSYLHPWGTELLLGVGSGGDENGLTDSVKFSLFCISDPEHPTEQSVFQIENSYLRMDSHKEFCMLGNDTFAVPVELYLPVSEAFSYRIKAEEKAAVLRIANGEVEWVGYLSMPSDEPYYEMRMTYIGDTIFLVADGDIAAFDRDLNLLCKLVREREEVPMTEQDAVRMVAE